MAWHLIHIPSDYDSYEDYESNLSVKLQRTSNNTYFRVHDINTALVKSENTTLENEILYNFNKETKASEVSSNAYLYCPSSAQDKVMSSGRFKSLFGVGLYGN